MIEGVVDVRNRTMQAVRSENTAPERTVRRLVWNLGYRYRLHRRDLPGRPDLAFIGMRKVIFVHGCFWHGHSCARGARVPKSNVFYWVKKISQNKSRDRKHLVSLAAGGWQSLVIWECELKQLALVSSRISAFLGRDSDRGRNR